jgi:beta-lactam-binding protein with PASTA domain
LEKDNIRVQMSDASGRIVYQKQYDNLVKGNNIIRIEPGSTAVIPPGMYFVRVIYTNREEQKTIKIIKQQ